MGREKSEIEIETTGETGGIQRGGGGVIKENQHVSSVIPTGLG